MNIDEKTIIVKRQRTVKQATMEGVLMNINYNKVSKLNSFYGVKLRGNETFDELLKIERDNKERIANEKANIQRVDNQIVK